MIVWHVCTFKKMSRYKKMGFIRPPVRAWIDINEAVRMSLSSKRRVIIRLRANNFWLPLEGHRGKAIFTDKFVSVDF